MCPSLATTSRTLSTRPRRHPRVRLVFFLALPLCTALFARAAAAQEPPELPPSRAYQLRLDLDLSVVLIAGAATSSFLFLDEAPGVACAPHCDRSHVNALDRPAAGLYHPQWSAPGDVATAATLLLPATVILIDEGLVDGLNDDLVVAESALVSSGLQTMLSYAVARPRPRVYSDEAPLASRSNANAGRSFFSGHVANTVATSVAALRTYQRLRRPVLGWTLLGVGLAGSAFVGFARVASGAHYPSDVVVGAAVGVGMGLALPALHDSPMRVTPYGSREGGGLMFSGSLR
jgi:membrane-associated phospholipid phosphatase